MAGCHIHDMNVITNACPVVRIIICPPNVKAFSTPNGDLRNKRKEVVRDTLLTDQTAFVCADWVKVPENANGPLWVTFILIAKHLLCNKLGSAVRIYRIQGMIFGVRQELGFAVNSRR